ncbi:retrovirus-related pol polyprotein from transposon TNT 1-94 [Tanacetum coccineum]
MKVREHDKPSAQHSRFLKMFKQLRLEIGLKDALVEMPKFNKWLSSLLRNKEKLEEIAITTVNAECSAIIMNKVPEKLEDPGKFLSHKLGLEALTPTRMTLEAAKPFHSHPIGKIRFSGSTTNSLHPSSSPVKTSDNIEKFTDELAPLDSLPSGNDDSTLKKEFHEVNFQVYSNPLFEFDESFKSSNVNPLFEENNKDVEIKSSSSSTLTSPEASELEDYLEKDSIPPGIDLTLPTTLEVLSSNPTFPTLTKEKKLKKSRKKKMKFSRDVPINIIVMPIQITFDNPIDFNDHFSKPKDLKKDLPISFDSTSTSILPHPSLVPTRLSLNNCGGLSASVYLEFSSETRIKYSKPGCTIVSIRTDHGRELDNEVQFGEFCNANEITHNFSAPHTPQSNGVVERKNRTLQEISKTMLNEQSLPKKFWCNAVDTSTYILNRVLIRAILGKTPYKLLRGRKPTLDYFRVFGSKCFILNTKDYLTKFDPKSYEGIFLGYSQNSKAYIILNKHTRKVEESFNVTFNETPPPSKTSPLVDDDLDKEEAIKVTEKKNLENNIVDETLEIDEIVNIKESRNHPLENVIGNLNQTP